MKFLRIDPAIPILEDRDYPSLEKALQSIGLRQGEIQIGSVSPKFPQGKTFAIAVHENGLYEDPETQKFFTIKRQLFAGPAIVFNQDSNGEICSLPHSVLLTIRWFSHYQLIIEAIERGEIDQPCIMVAGEPLWVWPQPMPGYSKGRQEIKHAYPVNAHKR